MNLAELKALQQTAAAAVADLGTGVDQLLDDTGTEIRKLVNGLVHDVDRVTYQRDVAERACRELHGIRDERDGLVNQAGRLGAEVDRLNERVCAVTLVNLEAAHKIEALEARIAELTDLVDEGDREGANIDTSLSDPQAGKLLVVRIDDSDVMYMRRGEEGLTFDRAQFVGWLEGPGDEGDTETKPVEVDVSHTDEPPSVIDRCGSCRAILGRGHLSDCAVGAILGGAA